MSSQQSIPHQHNSVQAQGLAFGALSAPEAAVALELHPVEALLERWNTEFDQFSFELGRKLDVLRDLAEVTILPCTFIRERLMKFVEGPLFPLGTSETKFSGSSFRFRTMRELQDEDIAPEILRLKADIDNTMDELRFGPKVRHDYSRLGHPDLGFLAGSLVSEIAGGHLVPKEKEVSNWRYFSVSDWSIESISDNRSSIRNLIDEADVVRQLYSFLWHNHKLETLTDPVSSSCALAARYGVQVEKLGKETAVVWTEERTSPDPSTPFGILIRLQRGTLPGRPLAVSWLHHTPQGRDIAQKL